MAGDSRPLSELTLEEADSFLEAVSLTRGDLKCLAFLKVSIQLILASDLHKAKGEDLTEKEKVVNFMDDYNTGADAASDTLDFTKKMLSKFDISSSVAVLDKVASLDPETVLSATCVVLSAASNVASMKFPDMTMHKVLASLERIEGNLKTMLEAPLKKAIDTFEFILKAVRTANFESAFDKLEKLIDNAETAFHYADKNKLSIKSYRECAKAIRLLMFGHLLKESYDKGEKIFVSIDRLHPNKVALIGETLEMVARKSIEQKKNVKTTHWGRENDNKKSEAQDILDSILKFSYPYISMAKKLTDINQQLMIQDCSSRNICKFFLLPDLLPVGHEDMTQLTLGSLSGSDGKQSAVKVNVWTEENTVMCEYDKYKNYKSSVNINSETEEVEIELPLPCSGPLTLSITGKTGNHHGRYKGDYYLTSEMHTGYPVYKNSEGRQLYRIASGKWNVGSLAYSNSENHDSPKTGERLLNSTPALRSHTAAPCPALCNGWSYAYDNIRYGDWWASNVYEWEYTGTGSDVKVACSVHN